MMWKRKGGGGKNHTARVFSANFNNSKKEFVILFSSHNFVVESETLFLASFNIY